MKLVHEDDLIAEWVAIRLILFVAVFIAVRVPWAIAPAASVAIGALEDRVDPVPIAARHSTTSLCVRESTQRSRWALFVVEDASRFLFHLASHRSPWLWELHKVHHSAEVLTPFTLYRLHPIEGFLNRSRGTLTTALVLEPHTPQKT
jgi:sterol desaturase/sphingolipid hydroxylase (fatty acid hydroxylase superfamily)